MVRAGLLGCVAFATACNALLGLDQTEVIESELDSDMDGTPDDLDNCPAIANADQADGDGDLIGDACDGCDSCQSCDRGPNHDEDGDKYPDSCDNCPALANPDQANDDGDELGDVCDVSSAFEHRLLFDGFGAVDDNWLETGARWTVIDDNVGPRADAQPGTFTLEHGTLGIASGTRWGIEIGLVPPPAGTPQLGVTAGTARFCFIEHAASGEWVVSATGTKTAPFTNVPAPIIRLRMTPTGPVSGQAVNCAIVDGPNVTSILASALAYPLHVTLVTNWISPQFAYIDVIGE